MITIRKQENDETNKLDKRKEGIQDRIIIEIEFCTNCDAHLFTVRHQQAKYSSHYQILKRKLQQQKVLVRKKSVPENLYKKSPYCPSNVYYKVQNNQLVYFPEIGSFEVYFNGNKIFSKIDSLKWPTAETIVSQVQKQLLSSSDKANNQTKIQANKSQQKTQRQQQQQTQNKKGQFRIKNKQQDLLNFRYSIDRRNLFKKPQNNYLYRKSLTSRYQSNTEATSRKNNTSQHEKQTNQEQFPQTQGRNRKDLSDQIVIQMYQKKQPQKIEEKINIPEVPRKSQRKNIQKNVYLQPIFPKTSVNLQSYARQKMIFANKIHEQRKIYEASKHLPKTKPQSQLLKGNITLNAKFNEDCNTLFKEKQLQNIKEATEQNEVKEKQYKIQITKVQELSKPITKNMQNKNQNKLLLPQDHQQQNEVNLKQNIQKQMQNIRDQFETKQKQEDQLNKQKQQSQLAQKLNAHQIHQEKKKIEQIDIHKIVTTKTIQQHEIKIKSQENGYQEQFEEEDQKNQQKNQQKQKPILNETQKQAQNGQGLNEKEQQYNENQFEEGLQNQDQNNKNELHQQSKQFNEAEVQKMD